MKTKILLSIFLTMALVPFACQAPSSGGDTSDNRRALELNPEQRAYFLQEMREFLFSINGVLAGVSTGDTATAIEAAKKSGGQFEKNIGAMPLELLKSLPEKFNTLRAGTHADFDRLAEVIKGNDSRAVMGALANITGKCSVCHTTYRVVPTH